jgi:hypothetical protein
MRKVATIKFNVPEHTILHAISRVSHAMHRESTVEERVLAYIIQYSIEGIYHAQKNSRTLCCERLKITTRQYGSAIDNLLDTGCIHKRENGSGSTYCFYELNVWVKGMKKKYLDIKK